MTINVPDGFFTVTQAARAMGLSSNCMNFHIAHGHIEVVEFNKGHGNYYRLISEEALEAFRKSREPDLEHEHLYEIICISCGEVSVLFKTKNLFDLSKMYVRMIENDHKLVRIRMDGVNLPIFESDKLGYTFHPRTKLHGGQHGKTVEGSQRGSAGKIPRHDKGCFQHGKEPAVLRRGACGICEACGSGDRAPAREPEEPVPSVPQGREGDVQSDPVQAERSKLSGISAGPGRGRFTEEERRLRARDRAKRYRQDNPDKSKEIARRYYEAHHEEIMERRKKYREAHMESYKAYQKQYREAHKEESKAYQKEYQRKRKEAKNEL